MLINFNNSYFNDINSNDEKSKNTQTINGVELSEQEVRQVRELESTDRNVKAHEAAHQAAGGGLAGGASFTYTRGPDNKMYATAGEVPIQMKEGKTPEETIMNARQIAAAALAPADPSAQDYKVAANAVKMEMQARAEAMKQKAEESKEKSENLEENSKQNFSDENANQKSKNLIIKAYKEISG